MLKTLGQQVLKIPSSESAPEDKTWEDFLQFIFGKSKVIYTILKDWKPLKLRDDLLEIESGNQKFSSSYFDAQEKYDQLAGYCRDFFQRDMQIKIRVKMQKANSEKHNYENRIKKAGTTKTSDFQTEVQDVAKNVLELFEGELIEK